MDFYRELNRIYCLNKFDTPEELLTLEPYFYTPSSLPVSIVAPLLPSIVQVEPQKDITEKMKPSPSSSPPPLPPIKPAAAATAPPITTPMCYVKPASKTSSEWFEPVQSDSLFWCVYTFVNGYSDYLMIGSKYANNEIVEKQKFFAFFKKCPKILKTTNCKITNQQTEEILSEMLSMNDQTSFLGIIALVVYYKINILLVHDTKKMYLSFRLMEDDNEQPHTQKTCVLYKHPKSNKRYKMKMYEEDAETISTIKNTMLSLESYMKPLRAISTYKITELEEIAEKLGIEVSKMKKQELYAKIQEYCVWQ
jgi:hypothetical protein